jgi:DNA polymerase-3 subunit delta
MATRKKKSEIHVAELERWLASAPDPRLVMIVGDEAVLRDRAVTVLMEWGLDPALADFNLDRFSGDDLDPARVVDACVTLPMMADRRVVQVRRFQLLHHSRRRKLLTEVQSLPETTMLLVEATALTPKERSLVRDAEGALLVTADRPGPREALRAIAQEAEEVGLELDSTAAEALFAARGNDLTGIALEINKLRSYVGERKRITRSDVEALVPAARNVTVFDLVDSLARSDLDRSLVVLDGLYAAGEDPLAVIGAAARHFLILWKAVLLGRTDRRRAAAILKVPPFFVDRYLSQAARFDLGRLHRILRELLEADLDLKGKISGESARRSRGRELVLRICASGRGARAPRRGVKGRA